MKKLLTTAILASCVLGATFYLMVETNFPCNAGAEKLCALVTLSRVRSETPITDGTMSYPLAAKVMASLCKQTHSIAECTASQFFEFFAADGKIESSDLQRQCLSANNARDVQYCHLFGFISLHKRDFRNALEAFRKTCVMGYGCGEKNALEQRIEQEFVAWKQVAECLTDSADRNQCLQLLAELGDIRVNYTQVSGVTIPRLPFHIEEQLWRFPQRLTNAYWSANFIFSKSADMFEWKCKDGDTYSCKILRTHDFDRVSSGDFSDVKDLLQRACDRSADVCVSWASKDISLTSAEKQTLLQNACKRGYAKACKVRGKRWL